MCEFVPREKQTYFQVETSPNAGKTNFFEFLVLVHGFLVIRGPDLFLANFFMKVNYDLINGLSWSRGENGRIIQAGPKGEKN